MKIKFLSLIILSAITYSQCDLNTELECENNNQCEWIEDIDYGSCSSLSSASQCETADGCAWEYGCIQMGWWYNWCYTYGYECVGGTYETDNSYCEEVEIVNCIDLDYNQCNHPHYGEGCQWEDGDFDCSNIVIESDCDSNGCDWINDTSYGNCGLLTVSECYDYPGECFVDSEPGWYDSSGPYCTGGTYQIDSSYCGGQSGTCEDSSMSGDVNGDYVINVQDIVQIVNLIFNEEYNPAADIDNNSTVDVLDIIQLVNIILN